MSRPDAIRDCLEHGLQKSKCWRCAEKIARRDIEAELLAAAVACGRLRALLERAHDFIADDTCRHDSEKVIVLAEIQKELGK